MKKLESEITNIGVTNDVYTEEGFIVWVQINDDPKKVFRAKLLQVHDDRLAVMRRTKKEKFIFTGHYIPLDTIVEYSVNSKFISNNPTRHYSLSNTIKHIMNSKFISNN